MTRNAHEWREGRRGLLKADNTLFDRKAKQCAIARTLPTCTKESWMK